MEEVRPQGPAAMGDVVVTYHRIEGIFQIFQGVGRVRYGIYIEIKIIRYHLGRIIFISDKDRLVMFPGPLSLVFSQ